MKHIVKRGALNLVLDLAFVAWVLFFLVSGRIIPSELIRREPDRIQATVNHSAEQTLPINLQPAPIETEPVPALVPALEDEST